MSSNKQFGFSLVEVLIVVALVGLVGVVGWKVYDNGESTNNTTPAASQSKDTVPAVNNASDLKASEDYLNSQDIDKQLDTSEIDSALSE